LLLLCKLYLEIISNRSFVVLFLLEFAERYRVMTLLEREEIKNCIKRELAKVNREIVELEKYSKPITPDCSLDDIGREEAMVEAMVQGKILEQVKKRKGNLTLALAYAKKRDYGICIVCEEPINIERLIVRPESIRCVHCAD